MKPTVHLRCVDRRANRTPAYWWNFDDGTRQYWGTWLAYDRADAMDRVRGHLRSLGVSPDAIRFYGEKAMQEEGK